MNALPEDFDAPQAEADRLTSPTQATVETREVLITPDLARAWLARNVEHNREIRAERVQRYARDIGSDRWSLTGDPIVFSKNGKLLDGQHRLEACLLSGRPFLTMVVFGVDPAVFKNLDGGAPRSRTDRLRWARNGAPNGMGAAMGTLNRLLVGFDERSANTMTPAEEERLLTDHPLLRESVEFVRQRQNHVGWPSINSALHYLMHKKDPAMADTFFDDLLSGTMVRAGDPVMLLRERLLSDRASRRRLRAVDRAALIIKAWNYTRHGERREILVWRGTSEKFPEIE